MKETATDLRIGRCATLIEFGTPKDHLLTDPFRLVVVRIDQQFTDLEERRLRHQFTDVGNDLFKRRIRSMTQVMPNLEMEVLLAAVGRLILAGRYLSVPLSLLQSPSKVLNRDLQKWPLQDSRALTSKPWYSTPPTANCASRY
jgi:hypothetical protein